jgi:hypothetical protein
MSNPLIIVGNGYSCDKCGQFVASGDFHICPPTNQPPYYQPVPTPYMAVLERIANSLDRLVDYFVRNIR